MMTANQSTRNYRQRNRVVFLTTNQRPSHIMHKPGTKLFFGSRAITLKLTLKDAEGITEPGSCGADEWIYHWENPDGLPFLTTDVELADLICDGATLTKSTDGV